MWRKDPQTTTAKRRKFFLIFFIVFVIVAGILKVMQYHWPKATIGLKDQQLHVLVAKTPAHRYKGLGNRENLGEYDGMIFLMYQSSRHGVVMRGMKFPLDVVWFYNGEVVDIAQYVPTEPGVAEKDLMPYYPRKDANMFLELPAGWVQEHGLKIGDRVTVIDE